jgi:hypothetical protein
MAITAACALAIIENMTFGLNFLARVCDTIDVHFQQYGELNYVPTLRLFLKQLIGFQQ